MAIAHLPRSQHIACIQTVECSRAMQALACQAWDASCLGSTACRSDGSILQLFWTRWPGSRKAWYQPVVQPVIWRTLLLCLVLLSTGAFVCACLVTSWLLVSASFLLERCLNIVVGRCEWHQNNFCMLFNWGSVACISHSS